MTESLAPMTKKDGITIASRILAAYFLYWAIIDLFNLLDSIYQIFVPLSFLAFPNLQTHYMQKLFVREIWGSAVRPAFTSLAAGWFYKSGPRVARFLLPETEPSPDQS